MFHWEPEGCYPRRLLYSNITLLVLNGPSLNSYNALVALNWQYVTLQPLPQINHMPFAFTLTLTVHVHLPPTPCKPHWLTTPPYMHTCTVDQGFSKYGPWAGSGPRSLSSWPARLCCFCSISIFVYISIANCPSFWPFWVSLGSYPALRGKSLRTPGLL